MKTTILTLLEDAKQHSGTAFGNDLARLANKQIREADEPDYEHGENDIHRLFRYVRETTGEPLTAERAVKNYTEPFLLQMLHDRTGSDSRELYCDALGITLTDFLYEGACFDFAGSAYPHMGYFWDLLESLMTELFTSGLYHHFTVDYISLIAAGALPYEPECFRNQFLIDTSEIPSVVEAISHFGLQTEQNRVRIIFLDENAPLDETFRRLSSQPDFLDFLHKKYAPVPLQGLRTDILQILAHL